MVIKEIQEFAEIRTKARAYFCYLMSRNLPNKTSDISLDNILEAIKKHKLYERVSFSIDSYQPIVVSEALDSGFKIVNDITGLKSDEVCKLCAKYDATAVIMHMQGTPQTMQKILSIKVS